MSIELPPGVSIRDYRRALHRENARYPLVPIKVPEEEWRKKFHAANLIEVWRAKDYLIQIYAEHEGVIRLSVCYSDINANREWKDGLSWDELQRIKRFVGYGDRDAVEVYPPDKDIVNVANMRHLWVLPEGLVIPCRWRNKPEAP